MDKGQVIGLDVGLKRTGIARASLVAKIAEPLATVETDKVLEYLKKIADVEAVVVGLPRNLEGEDTSQTEWVRQWTTELKPQLGRPLYWQDEALTTKLAGTRKKSSYGEDAEAASIILQDFLDTPENGRISFE